MNQDTIFWDVDTQFDFLHSTGRLYVPGADRIVDTISEARRFALTNGFSLIADVDWHSRDDPEISPKPDFKTTFPPHGMAGFAATSNVFAARALGLPPSETMAHSYVEVHDTEEDAFRHFAQQYGAHSILLVDTFDHVAGIKTAARVAKDIIASHGIHLAGIRLDSGDLVTLSRLAREHVRPRGRGVPEDFRQWRPRRIPDSRSPRRWRRDRRDRYRHERDIVASLDPGVPDLLQPFQVAEPMPVIQARLHRELSALPENVKDLRNPDTYPVQFLP